MCESFDRIADFEFPLTNRRALEGDSRIGSETLCGKFARVSECVLWKVRVRGIAAARLWEERRIGAWKHVPTLTTITFTLVTYLSVCQDASFSDHVLWYAYGQEICKCLGRCGCDGERELLV